MKRKIVTKHCVKMLLGLLIVLGIWGCGKKQGETALEQAKDLFRSRNDYELAQYVASHTSGTIKPDQSIQVRFTDNMVDYDIVGKKENRARFNFKPNIKGKAVWFDRQVLTFIPDKPLEKGKKYQVTLNLSLLFPDSVKVAPLKFSFSILKQDIRNFQADFVFSEDDREHLTYEGEVEFILDTDLATINKASWLRIKGRDVKLNWSKEDNKYLFKSETIIRDDVTKPIEFKILGKPLEMKNDLVRTSSLYSMHEMDVILVKRLLKQANPGLEVEFSDFLDDAQDINAYISIKPDMELSLQRFGHRVLINGEFEFGKSYVLTIKQGIKNSYEQSMKNEYVKQISFNDESPQIMFLQDGCFLTSGNERKIQFQTINVKKVHLNIKKVYENNLIYFLQGNDIHAGKTNNNDWFRNFQQVGESIHKQDLIIEEVRNSWLQQEIDLSNLIPKGDGGLYLVELRFNKKGVYYRGVKQLGNNRYNEDPNENGYYYRNGRVIKPVILSDLGVTVKQAGDQFRVYVTNVMTAKPISGAKVILKTYLNQVIDEQNTNGDGQVDLDISKKKAYFVEVSWGDNRTIVKLDEMRLNTSTYDVGGVQISAKGTRAYIYTERGVYRPGDPINLSLILRNSDSTFPDNHPVKINIKNPRHQKVLDRTLKSGVDGFYNFKYSTKTTDPTGTWKVKISSGSGFFYHDLKIETVVAERLKVEMIPEKEMMKFEDSKMKIDLEAKYLFGAPAANLQTIVKYTLIDINKSFSSKYNGYSFRNSQIDYKEISNTIFNSTLDKNGNAEFVFSLPVKPKVPSALVAKLEADVKEEGGRSSKKKIFLEVNPYPAYVGLKIDQSGWVKVGKKNLFQTILLDESEEPLSNENLRVRIYHNRRYWWWEYDRYSYNRKSFKTHAFTDLVREIKLTSSIDAQEFDFTPQTWGQYLVEVTHIGAEGEQHTTSSFFRASYWGNPRSNIQDAGMIDLQSDKSEYEIGEDAEISFPTPEKGNVLISLEKGDKILKSWWVKPKGKENTTIKIPLTADMTPNVYLSVAVLQPHDQTDNDRPLRMYGVIPIKVKDSSTIQKLSLKLPEVLRPNKKFKCIIKAGAKTQFTIAVVDEGLLSLTDFKSPDAWEEFYKKQRLGIITSDNYGYIIGANKADMFKIHSVGGGMSLDKMRKEKLIPKESKRFKPVCLFKGPLFTDENGFAEVEFSMPEYMGAVRVMVVSANEKRFGSASKTVEVKEDVVILPTIPRVLAPSDEFVIPVEIFATRENVGEVTVSLQVSKPIEIVGESQKRVILNDKEQKSVRFQAKVKEQVGIADIKIQAIYGNSVVESNTEITVRPLSARIYRSKEKACDPGKDVSFNVPDDGVLGSNKAYIVIKRLPMVDLGRRLNWLIRYPYGCVEQTTSAVFPQLYLAEFVKDEKVDDSSIVANINEAIERLQAFQTPQGGMSYWPGSHESCGWGTNYAGHFLLEAKEAGYFVPQEMLNNWQRFQKDKARSYRYEKNRVYQFREQIYRLYLLAKAGKQEMGSMNYIREKFLSKCDDTERWLLAATYKLAGANTEAERLRNTAGVITDDYLEHSGTYGSGLRDKAMILEAMLNFEDNDVSVNMFRTISEQISDRSWYSTQTTGYSLLALGKYIKKYLGDKNVNIKGQIAEADGSIRGFTTSEYIYRKEIEGSFGKKVNVELYKNPGLKKCFVSLEWSGVPLRSSEITVQDGIKLKTVFSTTDLNTLKQGDVITMNITVENMEDRRFENVALVQLLPSGWEIENERVNPDDVGSRQNSRNKIKIDYTDIRDDRIMWFFKLNRKDQITVSFKIRMVTEGTFYLPATSCEVMYDNRFKASLPGRSITISK